MTTKSSTTHTALVHRRRGRLAGWQTDRVVQLKNIRGKGRERRRKLWKFAVNDDDNDAVVANHWPPTHTHTTTGHQQQQFGEEEEEESEVNNNNSRRKKEEREKVEKVEVKVDSNNWQLPKKAESWRVLLLPLKNCCCCCCCSVLSVFCPQYDSVSTLFSLSQFVQFVSFGRQSTTTTTTDSVSPSAREEKRVRSRV